MPIKKTAQAARINDDGIALDGPNVQLEMAAKKVAAPPFQTNDWAARQRMRILDRQLRRTALPAVRPCSEASHSRQRLDPPQNLFDGIEAATSIPPITAQTAIPPQVRMGRNAGSQIVAWLIVVSGVVSLAAGIGTIAWSITNEQMRYWNLALALTLGGQGSLIFGLVMVVTRLWRSSRHAVNKLHDVHAQLAQLQHTADALAARNSGGSPAFYADLVRGASPQMLLSNLKGQVDQLATRLGSI